METDEEHIHLIFGAFAAEKPTETVRALRPMLAYLTKAMTESLGEDVTIEMHISNDYGDSIQDLLTGETDFARFGAAAYVTAKRLDNGVQIIAMEKSEGQIAHQGVIVVHQDSDIQSMADLTGRSFAFGRKLSAFGHYLVQNHLLDAGQNAQTLGYFAFHDHPYQVGSALVRGAFDVGVLTDHTFDEMLREGMPLRVIARFDDVAGPWITNAAIKMKIKAAMAQAFLDISDEQMLETGNALGFLSGSDADFDPIRAAMVKSRDFGD